MSRLGVVTAIAIGGLVAALFTAPSEAAQQRARAASRAFDGLWSVYIRTAYGPCDAAYRDGLSWRPERDRLWPAAWFERRRPLEHRRQCLLRHLERHPPRRVVAIKPLPISLAGG